MWYGFKKSYIEVNLSAIDSASSLTVIFKSAWLRFKPLALRNIHNASTAVRESPPREKKSGALPAVFGRPMADDWDDRCGNMEM